jgi:hypothetical protein
VSAGSDSLIFNNAYVLIVHCQFAKHAVSRLIQTVPVSANIAHEKITEKEIRNQNVYLNIVFIFNIILLIIDK